MSSDQNRAEGFTLIELLVVLSIISLLITLLLPSLGKARDTAIRLRCAAQIKQVAAASHVYATDHHARFPLHPNRTDAAHRLRRAGHYDLNATFVLPYIGQLRNTMLFCPGPLITARNPSIAQYQTDHVTYQYFNLPIGTSGFLQAQPDLTKADTAANTATFWSDMTLQTSGGFYFGHDAPILLTPPSGLNEARVDGSVRWVQWQQAEPIYLDTGNTFYRAMP
jgi:prepilin-type N-terminal cleavage/methylation domain-containing protein